MYLDSPTPGSENTGVEQPIQTDKTSNLLVPRSSQLQRTPDSVLSQKPKTVPGGDVPLSNPDLVRAPAEEGKGSGDCIVISSEECNFPYPIS